MDKDSNNQNEKRYSAVATENGTQVCSASGTLMEIANWADSIIRLHGDCTIDIRQESA